MKLAELFEAGATKGYDTSENNREHHDDYDEWFKAVRQAGGDVDMDADTSNVVRALAYDGLIGEFNRKKDTGWIIDSFVKKTKKVNEGAGSTEYMEAHDKMIDDIRDNWLSWSVPKIVKFVMAGVKDGSKSLDYMKPFSKQEIEEIVDSAKDQARNQFESMNEDTPAETAGREMRDALTDVEAELRKHTIKYDVLKKTKDDGADGYEATWRLWGQDASGAQQKFDKFVAVVAKRHKNVELDARIDKGASSLYCKLYVSAKHKGLNEGMYVVKSKDGVEKRFKDADSADAKTWKSSTQKKATVNREAQKKKELDLTWSALQKVGEWTQLDWTDLVRMDVIPYLVKEINKDIHSYSDAFLDSVGEAQGIDGMYDSLINYFDKAVKAHGEKGWRSYVRDMSDFSGN